MSENYAVGVEIPKWHAKLEKKLNLFPVSSVYEQKISHWPFFHKQPGIEIHITHGGNGTLVIGNQIIPQSAQKVCIFNGNVPHQSQYHPFNGWLDIAPIRGLILAAPKGAVSPAIFTGYP